MRESIYSGLPVCKCQSGAAEKALVQWTKGIGGWDREWQVIDDDLKAGGREAVWEYPEAGPLLWWWVSSAGAKAVGLETASVH